MHERGGHKNKTTRLPNAPFLPCSPSSGSLSMQASSKLSFKPKSFLFMVNKLQFLFLCLSITTTTPKRADIAIKRRSHQTSTRRERYILIMLNCFHEAQCNLKSETDYNNNQFAWMYQFIRIIISLSAPGPPNQRGKWQKCMRKLYLHATSDNMFRVSVLA